MDKGSKDRLWFEYDVGTTVGMQISDGMYLVLMAQSIYEDGTFNMMKAHPATTESIKTAVPLSFMYDVDPAHRGLAKMVTAENVLMFGGEVKGYVAKGNVIEQVKEDGNVVHGYLLGPLHMMPQRDKEEMMSCLCRGMGHITKDMWYIYQCKNGKRASNVSIT